ANRATRWFPYKWLAMTKMMVPINRMVKPLVKKPGTRGWTSPTMPRTIRTTPLRSPQWRTRRRVGERPAAVVAAGRGGRPSARSVTAWPISRCVMAGCPSLAAHGTEGDAPQEVVADQEREDEHGQYEEHRRGCDEAPIDVALAAAGGGCDARRRGARPAGRGEHKGEEE